MLNPYDGQEAVTFAYRIFLLLSLPVCAWVAWSDLKFMKIPNKAVMIVVAIFAFAGFVLIPAEFWLWRWVNFVAVLAIGFMLNIVANVGAGDAKFAAAIAPFFTQRIETLQGVEMCLVLCRRLQRTRVDLSEEHPLSGTGDVGLVPESPAFSEISPASS